MSDPFTNFLSGVAGGIFNSPADLKDYQHADRLFVKDKYSRAPKFGFLYFVVFNINPEAVKNTEWFQKNKKNVGMLVKRIDLPRFDLVVDTINQYNRKTVVQTGIKYNPVSMDFHDDNSDITTELWKSYYQYYYADSTYSTTTQTSPPQYTDTKYGITDYAYGLNNFQKEPFFKSIDIYVMHQQKFTQYTLLNPMVTNWSHDTIATDENNKLLASKMTVAYENVLYKLNGRVKKDSPEGFATVYYDTTPSPLSIGGNGTNTIFGAGGVISGASSVFGILGKEDKSPLDFLNAAVQAKTLATNIGQLSKAGLKQEGYSILSGVLGNIQTTGNQPGGLTESIKSAVNTGNIGALGNIGVKLFKNTSVDNTTVANIKKLTGSNPQ